MSDQTYGGWTADDIRRAIEIVATSAHDSLDRLVATRLLVLGVPALLDEVARLRAENERAAALLRACDAFTGRVRVLPTAFTADHWFAMHTHEQVTIRAKGATHTDALIALGDQLASPARGEE